MNRDVSLRIAHALARAFFFIGVYALTLVLIHRLTPSPEYPVLVWIVSAVVGLIPAGSALALLPDAHGRQISPLDA